MTTIKYDMPAVDELAKASAANGSLYKGLEHMAALGRLGEVAEQLGQFAEHVSKSGYVPPARRADYERHDRLAKSVQDHEVARYHRDKAREIRGQLGEEVKR